MVSAAWYTTLLALVGLERLAELGVARQNLAWSRARGGVERGQAHYPVMVALHVALLGGCLLEVWGRAPPFRPWLGWPALGVVAGAQALRWWCILTLGRQWNTRVVVVPGLPRVTGGPYRWLAHPNYLAVVLEGAALPLVHGCWVTALGFTLANLPLMAARIRSEERALAELTGAR